jgi:hypothetical protein
MAEICWLASYPKSGNTWLRALLANYKAYADQPVDINTLDTGGAAARILFDELTGIEASALDAETIDNLRPAVYRLAAREAGGLLFFKVHDMFRRNSRGEPLFPGDASAGAVYIVRNVMDLALSLSRHSGIESAGAVERLCDPGHAAARSEGRLDDQLRQVLGSWSGHVSSWLDQSELRVHLLRYEDLLRNPAEVFAGVVRFCGLPYDEERVHRAVAFSSFEELQRQEREHGFRERLEQSSSPFFRHGAAGRWTADLAPDLALRLRQAHGGMLRRLGYLNEEPAVEEEKYAADR